MKDVSINSNSIGQSVVGERVEVKGSPGTVHLSKTEAVDELAAELESKVAELTRLSRGVSVEELSALLAELQKTLEGLKNSGPDERKRKSLLDVGSQMGDVLSGMNVLFNGVFKLGKLIGM